MTNISKDTCISTRKTLATMIGEKVEVDGMPLSVHVGNITYSGEEMTVKVILRAEHHRPKEVRELEWMLETWTNLDSEKQDENGCRLYGYKPRSKKMPWIITDGAGAMFTCGDHYVAKRFWKTEGYEDDTGGIQLSADKFCFTQRLSLSQRSRAMEEVINAPAGAKKKSKKKAPRKSK
jgi:hypothetical protein